MNNVVKNSKTSSKKSVTAKQLAKFNLTKRKNPDWDNLDRGYRYLTLDMKLPHDLAVAVMGNVVEESLGNYKSVLKNGGGKGLIQWDGRKAPNGRYSLWGSIWASVAKPANVYDSTTDTVKNYWAPWGGLKGDEVRLKFIKAPLKEKAKIYAELYLRPGKPRIADRQLSTMQLDSIYNPRIKDVIVLKDGGMLEFLKNGSEIHIKKKNRGKFTSYCGGKVTDECIRKAKASGNPTLVKRATFAANARKWKHKNGGFVKGVNVLDSNPSFHKKRKVKKASLGSLMLANGISTIFSTYMQNKNLDLLALRDNTPIDFYQIFNKHLLEAKLEEELKALAAQSILGTVVNTSPTVELHNAYIKSVPEYLALKDKQKAYNKYIDAQVEALKQNNWINAGSSIVLGILSNLGTSTTTGSSTTGNSVYKLDSFWTNPTLKTSTPTYSFNTPTLTPPKTNYSFLK